jgi:SHS family lactate transporter-like MFS transporter
MRWRLPETNQFRVTKRYREMISREQGERQNEQKPEPSTFLQDTLKALRENWTILVYMVLLMSAFSFCSHGSQDFYPTFLKVQANMSLTDTTLITVIGQLGALCGGITIGYISTFLGRRLTMLCGCIMGAALVPAFVLPRGMSLAAGAFWQQLLVGGVWGPIPIYLVELSPSSFRALSVGLAAQLGNLVSSGSSRIQATMAEKYPLPPTAAFKIRYDYGKVITIFLAVVWAFMFVIILLGPEISEEERGALAADAAYLEQLRADGVNLDQIGTGKDIKEQDKAVTIGAKPVAEHVE